VLRQYFAVVQNLASCCLPSAYGIEQDFSNYGSWPQKGLRNVIFGLRNQLARQIRYNNFCKIYKKIESRPAVNLFLLHFYFFKGQYRTLCCQLFTMMPAWANVNLAQQVMRCYTMIVLTYWPILTLLHSFRHEGMLLLRVWTVFPKLCAAAHLRAAKEAGVCRKSFMFWQNLMLQILWKVGFRKVCEK